MSTPARAQTPATGSVAVAPRNKTAPTPIPLKPPQPRPGSGPVSGPRPGARPVSTSTRLPAVRPVENAPRALSERASSSSMLMQVKGPSGRQPAQSIPAAVPQLPGRSSRIVSPALRCTSCGCQLGQQSVAMGTAQMLDGKLVCLDCIRQQARAERARTMSPASLPVGKILIVACIALAGVGVVLPGQVLLLVGIAAVLGLAAAALGFTLPLVIRLSMALVSLLAIGGALYGISTLQAQSAQNRANAEISSDVANVREMLAADRFADAQNRLRTLAAAASRPGAAQEIKATVKALEAEHEQWLEKSFGPMNLQTRGALTRLLSAQAFKNASGSRRIRSLSLEEKTARLVVAFDCKAPEAADRDAEGKPLPVDKESLLEAVTLGAALFQDSSAVQTVEVQLINASGESTVGTFKIDSGDTSVLSSSPRIEDVMRLFKAGS